MIHDAMLLLYTGKSECQRYSRIKPLLMHRTVGIVLAYLNCHKYNVIVFVVVLTFTVVGELLNSLIFHDDIKCISYSYDYLCWV